MRLRFFLFMLLVGATLKAGGTSNVSEADKTSVLQQATQPFMPVMVQANTGSGKQNAQKDSQTPEQKKNQDPMGCCCIRKAGYAPQCASATKSVCEKDNESLGDARWTEGACKDESPKSGGRSVH